MSNLIFEITSRYTEPHRCYHGIMHPALMLNVAAQMGFDLTESQVMAIWMHDLVYNIPSMTNFSNEKASSYLAERLLTGEGFAYSFIKDVCQIIEDTELELPTFPLSEIVIDLDLWGIAHNYWKNRNEVRKEFSYLSEEEFSVGRRKWILSMLNRDKIYVSGKLPSHFESAARGFLSEDLKQIESFLMIQKDAE
jgi:predicted metal-dependent HD superfamily phosphohydrolase